MGALAEARALAASPRLGGGVEYQRAQLQVLLAILDRLEASAPPVEVAPAAAPAPAPEPKKRGK